MNIVCLATYFKGVDFIRECKSRGHQVVLITKEKMLGEDWPRESLDDLIALPNDADLDLFIHLLSLLSRQTKIDRVIALEEFDVITAAQLREHFCLAGMPTSHGTSVSRQRNNGGQGTSRRARRSRICAPAQLQRLARLYGKGATPLDREATFRCFRDRDQENQ